MSRVKRPGRFFFIVLEHFFDANQSIGLRFLGSKWNKVGHANFTQGGPNMEHGGSKMDEKVTYSSAQT